MWSQLEVIGHNDHISLPLNSFEPFEILKKPHHTEAIIRVHFTTTLVQGQGPI